MKLASVVKSGDERLFCLVNHKIRCYLLDLFLTKITHLGGAVFSIGFMAAMMLLGWSKPDGGAALLLSHLVVQLLKKSVARKRPYLAVKDVWVVEEPLKDFSFPSGHTAAIVSIAASMALWHPWIGFILFPVCALVGLSRVYLGHHYPTDVLIGATIGVAASFVSHYGWLAVYA